MLLILDAFRGQNSQLITSALDDYNIVTVMVSRNMNHLLQPLDLITNESFKKQEKNSFSEYITTVITKELQSNHNKDVATIDVYLKLSTVHAKLMIQIYEHFKSEGRQTILNL